MSISTINRQKKLQGWLGIIMLVLLITVTAAMFAAPQVAHGANPTTEDCGKGKVKLNVKLGTTDCITDITEYTKIFYRLFIGVIGIFAAVMIMYAGFQWISASGNAQKIDRAKDNFTSAIIGVVIALTAYVFLNLINPMIVNLNPIALETISGQATVANMELCKNMLGENWSQRVINPDASCTVQNKIKDAQGNATGGVCYGHQCGSGGQCFSSNGVWRCASPQEQCEKTSINQCQATDLMLDDRDFGCAKADMTSPVGWKDKCVYGPIINFEGTIGQPPKNYTRVSCGDSPIGVCWIEGGQAKSPAFCTNFLGNVRLNCTDVDRAVKGVHTICVKNETSGAYSLWDGSSQGDDITSGLCTFVQT